jgi:hypothetical protein
MKLAPDILKPSCSSQRGGSHGGQQSGTDASLRGIESSGRAGFSLDAPQVLNSAVFMGQRPYSGGSRR